MSSFDAYYLSPKGAPETEVRMAGPGVDLFVDEEDLADLTPTQARELAKVLHDGLMAAADKLEEVSAAQA